LTGVDFQVKWFRCDSFLIDDTFEEVNGKLTSIYLEGGALEKKKIIGV
jgi:hypothetical protein